MSHPFVSHEDFNKAMAALGLDKRSQGLHLTKVEIENGRVHAHYAMVSAIGVNATELFPGRPVDGPGDFTAQPGRDIR